MAFVATSQISDLRILDEIDNEIARIPIQTINDQQYVLARDMHAPFEVKYRYIAITGRIQMTLKDHRIDLRVGSDEVFIDGRLSTQKLQAAVETIADEPALPISLLTQILPDLLELNAVYSPELGTLRLSSGEIQVAPVADEGRFTVLIDPMRGGSDTGVSSGGVLEKTVNLKFAMNIGQKLTQRGVTVRYTRTSDQAISTEHRIQLANALKPDLYLAIACNGSVIAQKRGYRIVTDIPGGAPAESEKLAAATVTDRSKSETAERFAQALSEAFESTGVPGGAARLPIHLLSRVTAPALLVVIGFLSNDAERILLEDEDFAESLTSTISSAIADQFESPGQEGGNLIESGQ